MNVLDYTGLKSFYQGILSLLGKKQDTLKSGDTLKTINGESLLGSGNIQIDTSKTLDDLRVTATASQTSKVSASVTATGNTLSFSFGIPKGEKGEKGEKGDSGTGTGNSEILRTFFIYKNYTSSPNSSVEAPTGGIYTTENGLVPPTGWSLFPQENRVVYMSSGDFNITTGEQISSWTIPIKITGSTNTVTVPSYKTYVYKKSETKPDKPEGTALIPSGWQDYPDSTGQWWQCIGTVNGGTNYVTEWSEVLPVNGQDGVAENGCYTEFRFAVNESPSEHPSIDVSLRTPDGWTKQPPAVSSGEYLWMTTAVITAEETLDSQWSTPVRISGEAGSKGLAGKIVYPMGTYDASVDYVSTETAAPYVYDSADGNYYVLYTTMTYNGVEQGYCPSESVNNGNTYWTKFTGFEVTYTKIGIIANGLIGSAVFNGDWMFSQQGIDADGNSTNAYQDFNADGPLNSSNNFIPSVAINFKTGEAYFAAGKVRMSGDGSVVIGTEQGFGSSITIDNEGRIYGDMYQLDISVDSGESSIALPDVSRQYQYECRIPFYNNTRATMGIVVTATNSNDKFIVVGDNEQTQNETFSYDIGTGTFGYLHFISFPLDSKTNSHLWMVDIHKGTLT